MLGDVGVRPVGQAVDRVQLVFAEHLAQRAADRLVALLGAGPVVEGHLFGDRVDLQDNLLDRLRRFQRGVPIRTYLYSRNVSPRVAC